MRTFLPPSGFNTVYPELKCDVLKPRRSLDVECQYVHKSFLIECNSFVSNPV